MAIAKESSVLNTIPPELKMFAAKLVRAFYGQQCFVVFNRIQAEGHARDDALSLALRLEIKDVRVIIGYMKVSY